MRVRPTAKRVQEICIRPTLRRYCIVKTRTLRSRVRYPVCYHNIVRERLSNDCDCVDCAGTWCTCNVSTTNPVLAASSLQYHTRSLINHASLLQSHHQSFSLSLVSVASWCARLSVSFSCSRESWEPNNPGYEFSRLLLLVRRQASVQTYNMMMMMTMMTVR